MNLFYWKRRWLYPFTLCAGFFYGYVIVSNLINGNLAERKHMNSVMQPMDVTVDLIREYGSR